VKKGESSPSTGGHKRGKPRKACGAAQAEAQGRAEGSARGGAAGTRRRLPQLWQAWPLGQGVSTATTRPGHVAQVEEPALLLAHTSIELSPAASAAAALRHLDEPRAHVLLGDGSSNDKTDGWCLDTGATHHKTSRREFFTDLDSDVRGSVKFGDASGVEIKGVGSIIFVAESGEHRLLTGVYYIPALRNSIISLGQLDESGSRVEIKDGVMRIWDRHRRLLAKVTRGTN
jgi:hypothetical protein